MKEYKRKYPLFALCGLNCGLCPRFHTDGTSRCPGCGGKDFHLKHPSCAVIACSRDHDGVEFCFECSDYPCKKYRKTSTVDSFITYRNVLTDFEKAKKRGVEKYVSELKEKMSILEYLLENADDGRKKSFFCNAVNLLDLESLRETRSAVQKTAGKNPDIKGLAAAAAGMMEEKARKSKIDLKLRK